METWAIFMIIGIFIWPFFIVGLILLIAKSGQKKSTPDYVTVDVTKNQEHNQTEEVTN